jgi:hypothetical protein
VFDQPLHLAFDRVLIYPRQAFYLLDQCFEINGFKATLAQELSRFLRP